MKRWQRLMITAITSMVCTYFATEVIASNLGTLSHLRSNPPVVVSDFEVIVPREYFVAHSGDHLSLVKFSPKLPSMFRRSIVVGRFARMNLIDIFDHTNDNSQNRYSQSQVEDLFMQAANKEHLELQNRKLLETGIGKVVCLQFGNSEIVRISCLSTEKPIYIYFDGEIERVEDLYHVINSISVQHK